MNSHKIFVSFQYPTEARVPTMDRLESKFGEHAYALLLGGNMERFQSFVDSTEKLNKISRDESKGERISKSYNPIYVEDHDVFEEMRPFVDAPGSRLDQLSQIRENVHKGSVRDSQFAKIVRDVLGPNEPTTAKEGDLIESIVIGRSAMVAVNKAQEAMVRKGNAGIFCTLKSKNEGLGKLDTFVFLFRAYFSLLLFSLDFSSPPPLSASLTHLTVPTWILFYIACPLFYDTAYCVEEQCFTRATCT